MNAYSKFFLLKRMKVFIICRRNAFDLKHFLTHASTKRIHYYVLHVRQL